MGNMLFGGFATFFDLHMDGNGASYNYENSQHAPIGIVEIIKNNLTIGLV